MVRSSSSNRISLSSMVGCRALLLAIALLPIASALRYAAVRPRSRTIHAIADISDISVIVANNLPDGFEAFEPEAQIPWATRFLEAACAYTILDVVIAVAPRFKAAILKLPPPELVNAPVSSFGFLELAGTPLPPLAQLEEEECPVGVCNGNRVFLCSESHLIRSRRQWKTIEVSEAFTAHYQSGERVYVCTARSDV